MTGDQADEQQAAPTLPVTLELSAGAVTINVRAHEPLDKVAAVVGELLKQATADAPRPQSFGFSAGSMVHVETPCTEPAEPYAGTPATRSGRRARHNEPPGELPGQMELPDVRV